MALTLRKDTLTELTSDDLAGVAGGSVHVTIDTYPTHICWPLATAVVATVRQATTKLTVVDCA